MKEKDDSDLLAFRSFRNLDGSVERVSTGRRNKKRFAILPPAGREVSEGKEAIPLWEQERLYVNLNFIERETWQKVLKGQPIKDIAREEGVSRQAIYSRIVGNSKHQGGMIGKNFWVLLWWLARQNQNNRKDSL